MSYLSINGTEYMIREEDGRGRLLQIENRRRAIDASLLVDSIATKREVQTQIVGLASAGRFFTPAEADSLMAALAAGTVTITGDVGSFTARARDIGWTDGQHYPDGPFSPPTAYRWVSVTLEGV